MQGRLASDDVVATEVQAGPWRIHALESRLRQAPTLVLLHGLAISSRSMAALMPELAPHAHVRAPDLPGWGKSQRPRRPLTIVGLADALADYLRATGPADVIAGVSFGCQVVVEMLARHPDAARSAVLLGPTCDPRARSVPRQVGRWLRDVPHEPMWMAPVLLKDVRDCGLGTLRQGFHDLVRHRIEERIREVPHPVMVVRGGLDPIVPLRWAEQLAAAAPRARMVQVEGVAHTLNTNAPVAVAGLLLRMAAQVRDDQEDAAWAGTLAGGAAAVQASDTTLSRTAKPTSAASR